MSATATAPADATAQLHSGTAGVIVERVAKVPRERLTEAVASAHEGSAVVFREAFGTRNRLHALVHAASLDELADGSGADAWDGLAADGDVTETVMLPQFVGMYGTSLRDGADVPERRARFGTAAILPPAQHQVDLPAERTLNTLTAGAIIHRTGRLRYEFRAEGRQFAREVAQAINGKYDGEVTVFLYEEAFGPADQIHWLIHLRALSSYYALIDGHAWATEADRELYSRQRVAPEKGGGDWSRLFVERGLRDVLLTRIDPRERGPSRASPSRSARPGARGSRPSR